MTSSLNRSGAIYALEDARTLVDRLSKNENVETIKSKLCNIDERIDSWTKIAERERIDISEERGALRSLRTTKHIKEDERMAALTLRLIAARKQRICRRIVQKVRKNLQRAVAVGRIEQLRKQLFEMTNTLVIPWIKFAIDLGLDIKKEYASMHQANVRALEQLKSLGPRDHEIREINLKGLLLIRKANTSRIIQKAFMHLIAGIGKREVQKDLSNEERVSIVTTIMQEALSRLALQGSLNDYERHCRFVFKCFEKNVKLYNEDPEEYHRQADKEWLLRGMIKYSAKMISFAHKLDKPDLAEEIAQVLKQSLSQLEKTDEISGVKDAFDRALQAAFSNHLTDQRERLLWNVLVYSEKMIASAQEQKKPALANQIWGARTAALNMLDEGRETKEVEARVEEAFRLFTERLGFGFSKKGCGFKDRAFRKH